jgi:hypothetical protein
MRYIPEKGCRENQKAQFIFKFFPENLTVYEIMWTNMVGPGRPRMTVGILWGSAVLAE